MNKMAFVIASDKVEAFLNEKVDEETVNKICRRAERFEKGLKNLKTKNESKEGMEEKV